MCLWFFWHSHSLRFPLFPGLLTIQIIMSIENMVHNHHLFLIIIITITAATTLLMTALRQIKSLLVTTDICQYECNHSEYVCVCMYACIINDCSLLWNSFNWDNIIKFVIFDYDTIHTQTHSHSSMQLSLFVVPNETYSQSKRKTTIRKIREALFVTDSYEKKKLQISFHFYYRYNRDTMFYSEENGFK